MQPGMNGQSLLMGRRQKRLNYWKAQMQHTDFSDETGQRFSELYSTYLLLLAKLTKAVPAHDIDETEARMSDIERELTSLFESRRLMTSPIGYAAIK